jgi:hypothetical protein
MCGLRLVFVLGGTGNTHLMARDAFGMAILVQHSVARRGGGAVGRGGASSSAVDRFNNSRVVGFKRADSTRPLAVGRSLWWQRSGRTPERNAIGHMHARASSEQAWEPMASSSAKFRRITRTVHHAVQRID